MLERKPNAFLLLTLIAAKCARSNSNQCVINSGAECGLSRQQYRTSLKDLANHQNNHQISIKPTNRGHRITIEQSDIYTTRDCKCNHQKKANPTTTSTIKTTIKNGGIRDESYAIADRLISYVTKYRNITITHQGRVRWADSIDRLERINHISFERMEKAISALDEHHGEEFWPDIQSGTSFRTKFIKIEAAIKRNGQSNPKQNLQPYLDLLKD